MTDDPSVSTEGTGRYEQLGDRAELDIGFSAAGPDRTEAVAALGRRVAAAAAALDHPGITVRHRRLWVGANWHDDQVVGCRAGEQVALVVTDVAALEEILAALVRAEPSDLHGPRWAVHDPAAAQREAQRLAVVDARERAEGYAAALGGRLGALRSLTDGSGGGASARMLGMAARAESMPDIRDLGLEPEMVEVTARCTTTWQLLL